jgi:hypothetical protein
MVRFSREAARCLPAPLAAQILPEFFRHFWVRRMALDRRNYRALVETTVEVAGKVRRRLREDAAQCVPRLARQAGCLWAW